MMATRAGPLTRQLMAYRSRSSTPRSTRCASSNASVIAFAHEAAVGNLGTGATSRCRVVASELAFNTRRGHIEHTVNDEWSDENYFQGVVTTLGCV